MLKPNEAIVIIASPETNADLFWATHFWTPDPIKFIQTQNEKLVLVSKLEFARAKREIPGARVLSENNHIRILRELNVTNIIIHGNTFSYSYARDLEQAGFKVTSAASLFEERAIKTAKELVFIEEISRRADEAIAEAIEVLRQAKINSAGFLYAGEILITSELLKEIVTLYLWKYNCLAAHTIISSGIQSYEPHNEGSGPIKAHAPIIMDVFPRSLTNGYFTDTTRTFCKGKAPKKLRNMFNAVLTAQQNAINILRPDIPAKNTNAVAVSTLERAGFRTDTVRGLPQGFIHDLGHGVGVEIHEEPKLNARSDAILTEGNVVTIEPGLYYPRIGGVRIEDTLVITENGYRSLTNSPKEHLEIA